MTPTEQDKELREASIGIVEAEYKMPNYIPAVERVDHIMHLITVDRKRVALEARIDEVETPLVKIMAGDSDYISIEYFKRRLAELKAQQEEL